MKRSIWIMLMMCFTAGYLQCQQRIDFTDQFFKFDTVNSLGKRGFGLYDSGDNKYKIFDWNFKKTIEIPIPLGEGKGDIQSTSMDAFVYNDHLYVHADYSDITSIFNMKGQFVKDFKLDIKQDYITCWNNKVFAFNRNFFIDNNGKPSRLCHIIDPQKMSILKTVMLKERFTVPSKYAKNPNYLFSSFLFAISDTGNIFILDPANLDILQVSNDGDILSRTKLPFETEIYYRQFQIDGKSQLVIDIRQSYHSFCVVDNYFYVLFYRGIRKKGNPNDIERKASLLKIDKNGKYKELVFNGHFNILGENNKKLYLYERLDYYFVAVDLSNWK